MKTLVVYYSKTGNNAYLAKKIAGILKSDSEEIKPRLDLFPFLILFSLFKTGMGIKAFTHKVPDYDRIILCGPIWMGTVISPLRDFIRRYGGTIKKLYFATCCGGSDAQKEDRFGYAPVFRSIKEMLGEKCVHCEAFPISMVIPEGTTSDGDATMKTRLSDQNFVGDIQKRLDGFIEKVSQ
jgi:flavodoxin